MSERYLEEITLVQVGSASGRLVASLGGQWADVARLSGGRFGPDPQALYARWDEFTTWWSSMKPESGEGDEDLAGVPDSNPLPGARQVLAVGMNFGNKRERQAVDTPHDVAGAVKLLSSLTGPMDRIGIDSDDVVLDAEVAVVVKAPIERARERDVTDLIAGLVLGLDLVDRRSVVRLDMGAGVVSYLNPGKSRPGFTPLGPYVVGLDEVPDLDDVDFFLDINGRRVQQGSTSDALFSPLEVVARLSRKITLLPGDVILLGGGGNLPGVTVPPLAVGDVLTAGSSLLGNQRHVIVSA